MKRKSITRPLYQGAPIMTDKSLRYGWTTGACAMAAASAAYRAFVGGGFSDPVTITLPKEKRPSFPLSQKKLTKDFAMAAVIKDAGDDPDVTHGAEITATISENAAKTGIVFAAGNGVGAITLAGLPLDIGEPAINPAPRAMIKSAISAIADELKSSCDVIITLSVPGGEKIAKKTMNPRLGIIGGISILGTTGVVVPYSCSAWIHSIHSAVDVARAAGLDHLGATTGSVSENALRGLYDFPETALIEMGDFAGGLFKYLRKHPPKRLTLAGGFAKISKLADGAMDLHSSRSHIDIQSLCAMLADLDASDKIMAKAEKSSSALGVLEIAKSAGLALGDAVAGKAFDVARKTLSEKTSLEVLVFDRKGHRVGSASNE
jgi:cobalt-precorrin-5B (C1)-methyltransferase